MTKLAPTSTLPLDRKKPRKPTTAMQREAIHLVDEYWAGMIKSHGVGFVDAPDDGRVRAGLQTQSGRRTRHFSKADPVLEEGFRWLSERNLAELKHGNGWTYIEVCLDRRCLGDRDRM